MQLDEGSSTPGWEYLSVRSDGKDHHLGSLQQRLDQTMVGLDGVIAIADNILVYGEGRTNLEAGKTLEQRLRAFLQRAKEKLEILPGKVQAPVATVPFQS